MIAIVGGVPRDEAVGDAVFETVELTRRSRSRNDEGDAGNRAVRLRIHGDGVEIAPGDGPGDEALHELWGPGSATCIQPRPGRRTEERPARDVPQAGEEVGRRVLRAH